MITESDIALSREDIDKKYPNGSPDYPSHSLHCGCSGCYASWLEWRSGHANYELGVAKGRREAFNVVSESLRDHSFAERVLLGVGGGFLTSDVRSLLRRVSFAILRAEELRRLLAEPLPSLPAGEAPPA